MVGNGHSFLQHSIFIFVLYLDNNGSVCIQSTVSDLASLKLTPDELVTN